MVELPPTFRPTTTLKSASNQSQNTAGFVRTLQNNERQDLAQFATPEEPEPYQTVPNYSPDADLGQRILRARQERGLKQKDLAGKDFSPSYISAIENGKIKPSLGSLEKLAARLGKPVTFFVSTIANTVEATSHEIVELMLTQVRTLIAAGKSIDALAQLHKYKWETLELQQQATYLFYEGSAMVKLGKYAEAVEILQNAQTHAHKNGQRELTERARNMLAVSWYQQGRFSQALELSNQGRQAINKGYITDPDLKLKIYANLANVHLLQERHAEAVDLYTEGLRIISDGNLHESLTKELASIYWGLSLAHRDEGDLAQARNYALKSLALFDTIDNVKLILRMRETLGSILTQSEDHDQAELIFRRMIREALDIGDRNAAAMAYINLTFLYLKTGDLNSATETSTLAMSLASEGTDKLIIGQAQLKKAQVHAARQERDQAQIHFALAIESLESSAAWKFLSTAYFEYGQFLKLSPEPEQAIEYLEKAYMLKDRSK